MHLYAQELDEDLNSRKSLGGGMGMFAWVWRRRIGGGGMMGGKGRGGGGGNAGEDWGKRRMGIWGRFGLVWWRLWGGGKFGIINFE